VLMIHKVIYTVKTDIVKLVVEIESFGMSSNEFDKETGLSDRLQPKQADLSCVHALNELHLHEIHVIPSKDYAQNIKNQSKIKQYQTQDLKSTPKAGSTGIFLQQSANEANPAKILKFYS
nr:hypothetical protein [Tanacetum cinerariifolium]